MDIRGYTRSLSVIVLVGVYFFIGSHGAEAQVVISEFLASNDSSIEDEDGSSSDWIELFNTNTLPVDIAGWHLTDSSTNLTAWTFPSPTVIAPNDFLIVFASEKNRAVAGAELHTDFALSRNGEYLALIKPDLSPATEFAPAFPEVQPDESYGFPMTRSETVLVAEFDPGAYIVPSDNSLATNWTAASFDDSGWTSGQGGIGYENTEADYRDLINTPIPGGTLSVYTRFSFVLPSQSGWNDLTLKMKYDDGFIAYLNGGYISGANEPINPPVYNSTSDGGHDDALAAQFEFFDARHVLYRLTPGTNTLAIHGLNTGAGSSDMLVLPELVAAESQLIDSLSGPFSVATPGGTNPSGINTPIDFSEENRLFTNSLTVAISTAVSGSTIRYTTDGTDPDAFSSTYVSALTFTNRTILKAVVFFPAGGNSEVATRRYIEADPALLSSFDSSLPLVVIDTFNTSIVDSPQRPGLMTLIEPVGLTGRSDLTVTPSISTLAQFSIRGSSSSGFAKKQYKMELVSEALVEEGADLLGMGEESDWILYAPGRFDRNMIANNFMYEIAQRMDQPAMDTQFIEVFLNDDDDIVDGNDYDGIYVLIESIERDENRIDVKGLDAGDTVAPGVTGGYLLSVDRLDNNQFRFNRDPDNVLPESGGNNNFINVIDPKDDALVQEQKDYIETHITGFATAITGPNRDHSTLGYRGFIDDEDWAEYHMLNVLAANVDAFRLSGYYYKDRNGLLMAGPQWDFDRTLESADGRDNDPLNIRGVVGSTLYFEDGWWGPLFDSEEFRVLYQDLWFERRRVELTLPEFSTLIDGLEGEISEAYVRPGVDPLDEESRWNGDSQYGSRFGAGNLTGESTHLKDWLGDRLGAFDTSMGYPPLLSQFGGVASNGYNLVLSFPTNAVGTMYYTLDGSDPRLEGGAVASNAVAYAGPIVLTQSTHFFARIAYANGSEADFPYQRSVDWSAKAETLFFIDPFASSSSLVITEIHYNPYEPSASEAAMATVNADDYEFIELSNISTARVDLSGVACTNGIDFAFEEDELFVLEPGQRVVLAPSEDAFFARYTGVSLAGEYEGQLSNQGESLSLVARGGELIQEVTYPDLSESNGAGHSLVVIPGQEGVSEETAWQVSCEFHGTPETIGASDCRDVIINEILAHTDYPLNDRVELLNTGTTVVDIGNWLISDSTRYVKYQISTNTLIQPGEFMVFDESDFNPNGNWNPSPSGLVDSNRHFALSASMGDEVYLVAADANTNVLRVADSHSFRATLNGQSLGRFPNGSGAFYPLAQRSFGASNLMVQVGGMVISEVMYNPTASIEDGHLEFIEISNVSTQAIDLAGWALAGAVDFTFMEQMPVQPGNSVVLVDFDPQDTGLLAAFQAVYGGVQPVGPWSGRLNNAGETIWLLRADEPPADNPGFTPLAEEERVDYAAESPWDVGADGTGQALARVNLATFADTATNWTAAVPAAGLLAFSDWAALFGGLSDPLADADGDGHSNEEERQLGTNPLDAQSRLVASTVTASHTVVWHSQIGRRYRLQHRASLSVGSWVEIPGLSFAGTGGSITWTDTDPFRIGLSSEGYYRVVVE